MADADADMSCDIPQATHNAIAGPGNPEAGGPQTRTKTRLARVANQIIAELGLKQAETAEILGIAQPRVSALKRCKRKDFSIGKLIEILTRLDQDVEITVRPCTPHRTASVSVLRLALNTPADFPQRPGPLRRHGMFTPRDRSSARHKRIPAASEG
ncbi:MAG: helix-turn-helix domain-containing protein [Alphaproteobacteria bacterium]|nr:helix-turn-helix domain-containing protein [Alphaproteobacteria bacterium]